MTDVDLINVLTRLHRDIVVPDIERIVDERIGRVDGRIESLHNEMLTNFDYVRRTEQRISASQLRHAPP